MCGIVSYFGDAPDGLNRVLTGMAAIVYRAPDSTGVALFGDQAEPIRIRRSLGSVAELTETLLDRPVFSDPAAELLRLWLGSENEPDLKEAQRRLLVWEGFQAEAFEPMATGAVTPPTWAELTDSLSLVPGQPGRVRAERVFRLGGPDGLGDLARRLMTEFNLPSVVVERLIRTALKKRLETAPEADRPDPEAVLTAFGEFFQRSVWTEERTRPDPVGEPGPDLDSLGRAALAELLTDLEVVVPADFDTDGVRRVFRFLDAALAAPLSENPDLRDDLTARLTAIWPEAGRRPGIDWFTLYQAEKGLNVFGWAASAGLAHLQQTIITPPPAENDPIPGRTDPVCLKRLSPPVIGHGRWALQCAVTVENTHPFWDAERTRALALNGQFSGETEAATRRFLAHCGYTLRSDNSAEYAALMWGHYFRVLNGEKRRVENTESQIEAGLEEFCLTGPSLDHQVFRRLSGLSAAKVDELAFIEAVRRIVARGGQAAVAGVSLTSPGRLFVASHNRPVFIVRRPGGNEFMVVSDINAALGLFPQAMIVEKSLELKELARRHEQQAAALASRGGGQAEVAELKRRQAAERAAVLSPFKVAVVPLEGEEVFARVERTPRPGRPARRVVVTDFEGRERPEIEELEAVVSPLSAGGDIPGSHFEAHLGEIPDRLSDVLAAYAPEGRTPPRLDIREDLLRRRFGPSLAALRRVILTGLGSSYNVCLMASQMFKRLVPELEVLVLRPVEVDDASRIIDPEEDLVVMVSWSGATAEMIELAKDLLAAKATMVGVTEKPFSDLNLIMRRSAGVIPCLSGEEVTISAVKSSACLLICLHLLAAWLAAERGRGEAAAEAVAELGRLPQTLARLLEDKTVSGYAENLAARYANPPVALVIDALASTGLGREAAAKLEQAAWRTMGKSLDYREAATLDPGLPEGSLVVVNATHHARLAEALEVMEKLSSAGLPFEVVTSRRAEADRIEHCGRGRGVTLPKLADELQPFVDLVFYYLLALHFGRAQGRGEPGFPRNLAKAVTTARSRPAEPVSSAEEMKQLRRAAQALVKASAPDLSRPSLWEREAVCDWERRTYREFRRLARLATGSKPLVRLAEDGFDPGGEPVGRISEGLSEGGEIIFLCLDRGAEAAARGVSAWWSRLTGGRFSVASGLEPPAGAADRGPCLILAAQAPAPETYSTLAGRLEGRTVRVGPGPAEGLAGYHLSAGDDADGSARLWLALHLLLVAAWRKTAPAEAETVERVVKGVGPAIEAVLDDGRLLDRIREAMSANHGYNSALFIGPPTGHGQTWVERFDRTGAMAMESYLYGESAHGPLVTVDPALDEKYVSVTEREAMAEEYGREAVERWETEYFDGRPIGSAQPVHRPEGEIHPGGPFSVQGRWYLPVLRPGYDPSRDNLIIIDASSGRFLDRAWDELSAFACRNARLVVIGQEAFTASPERRRFSGYPIDHLIDLPTLGGGSGGAAIPDLLLPPVQALLAAAAAAAAADSMKT